LLLALANADLELSYLKGTRQKMHRIALVLSIMAIAISPGIALTAEHPNIVYILVDNWGWGDISVQGSSVSTPRIDEFARQGIRFTNFNVQNQCTPTRSAIHTGRLPIRSGTWKVPAPGEPQGMAPWEYTIAELLSDAGYATAMYGKWHIGDKDGRLPNDQGYDEWYGTKESAMEASYTSTPQFDPAVFPIPHIWSGRKGEKSKKVKPFDLTSRALLDREIVEKTSAFVETQTRAGRPFFVYAALTQIHPPFLPHPDFKGKSNTGAYADVQLEVDYNVGCILDAIRQAGVAKNTIVILTGDNAAGEDTGEGGSNGPWRGGLSTAFQDLREHGVLEDSCSDPWPTTSRVRFRRVSFGLASGPENEEPRTRDQRRPRPSCRW
jgi:arylsulfatase